MKFNQYACSIDEKIHATIMQVCCTLLVSGCNSQVATLGSIELALTVFLKSVCTRMMKMEVSVLYIAFKFTLASKVWMPWSELSACPGYIWE